MTHNQEAGIQETGADPKLILAKWKFIAFTVVMISALVFFFSAVLPPVYSSESQFLILQKNLDIDAYRAAKSSEYAGSILERVIGSTNFMDGVLESRHDIEDNFGEDPKERMKNWQKTVTAKSVANTGIIDIQVFHENRDQEEKIMSAITEKLLYDGKRFHGNDNIVLKKIGGPVYYRDPEYPKVWLNTAVAAVLGFFTAVGLILVFGENVDSWMYARKSRRSKLRVIADRKPAPTVSRHNETVPGNGAQTENGNREYGYIAPVEAEIWAHPEPAEPTGASAAAEIKPEEQKTFMPNETAPPANLPRIPEDSVKNLDYRERLRRIIGE